MNRRHLIGSLGVSTAAIALGAAQDPARTKGAGGQNQGQGQGHGQGHGHGQALQTMAECARMCNETAAHCLEQICKKEGDVEAHAKVHQMTMDCQAFCVMASALMARQSPMAKFAHEANAEACRMCAEACDQHADNSPMVKQCAEHCRRCEQVCREAARSGHEHADHK